VTVIVLNVALTFLFSATGDINNYAHIGGLITGAALGAALPPLAAVGGKDLGIIERCVLWAAIAFSAVALAVAVANLVSAIHGVPLFTS
jgi:hypothetical protein